MKIKPLLIIENLGVSLENKQKLILDNINLRLNQGECLALLGPNGSGKTILAQTIAGNPHYKIIKGSIYFKGKLINELSLEKRVGLGIALAWQTPPVIEGVKLQQLFSKINKKNTDLSVIKELLSRDINLSFSGGEKRISELIQVLALNPQLVILDEIDSGLDVGRLKEVAEIIQEEFLEKRRSVFLITHSGEILRYLKPQKTLVLLKGKIVCEHQDYKLVFKTIKKYGYEKCFQCPFWTNR